MADMRLEADANYHFGEIKMWHDGPRQQETGVIVEAKSDENFYSKFFNDSCVFFNFSGWEKALGTISQANKHEISGILAIIDADFKRILNVIPEQNNLFLTDFHDKEMMMINSRAWEGVLHFYADQTKPKTGGESKLNSFEQNKDASTKDFLLQCCKPIACLRFSSQRDDLNLKFKTFLKGNGKYKYIDYRKFIDNKNLELNTDKLLTEIENKSSKPQFFKNNPDKKQAFLQLQTQDFDLLEFCNGHDFINIFSISLEKVLSNKASGSKVAAETIEKDLIIAYRSEDFVQTGLYQALIGWEGNSAYQLFN